VPSEAGLVQTLPPIDPLGTDQWVCKRVPDDWSNSLIPPRINGLSHAEDMPMLTFPPTTVGEAQLYPVFCVAPVWTTKERQTTAPSLARSA